LSLLSCLSPHGVSRGCASFGEEIIFLEAKVFFFFPLLFVAKFFFPDLQLSQRFLLLVRAVPLGFIPLIFDSALPGCERRALQDLRAVLLFLPFFPDPSTDVS